MCRNIKVSIITFVFSAICVGLVLTMRPDSKALRYLAVFTLTFASMQLADAMLWWSLINKNKGLNWIVSRFLIPLILIAELLVGWYAAKHYLGYKNRAYEALLWCYVAALLVAWIVWCKNMTVVGGDGYLLWCDFKISAIYAIMFFAFLIAPILLAFPNDWLKVVALSAAIITFLANIGFKSFGTRWCWSANITSFALLLAIILKY